MNDVRTILDARCPGLYTRIEELLVEAEARYNETGGHAPSEFLLDHTRRTAAITRKLAEMEGLDPFLPALVALYHDAGKFHEGEYHKDGVPEEEHAAILAGKMLAEFRMDRSDIDAVLAALRALYDDRLPCVGPCRVVQDADRLDKLGTMGVGAFFTKAALRGRGLVDALVQTLSRELTYARAAPLSMFTQSGKKLAGDLAAKTLAFFDLLLEEMESWGIASFERRTIVLEEDFRTRDGALVQKMEVTVVMLRDCPACAEPLTLTHERRRGVKCEEFIAHFHCGCGYASRTSLCLPVLA